MTVHSTSFGALPRGSKLRRYVEYLDALAAQSSNDDDGSARPPHDASLTVDTVDQVIFVAFWDALALRNGRGEEWVCEGAAKRLGPGVDAQRVDRVQHLVRQALPRRSSLQRDLFFTAISALSEMLREFDARPESRAA